MALTYIATALTYNGSEKIEIVLDYILTSNTMDYIIKNKQKITNWYAKELAKERIYLPPLKPVDGWCDIPNPIMLRLAERHLGASAVLIHVKPLLQRNICHYNVSKMLKVLNQKEKRFKGVLGYNVTGCPCGKLYGIEIHSVLKCDDEYIDLTKDFAGATRKYFIPLKEWDIEQFDEITDIIYQLKLFGQDCANFGTSHSCRIPMGLMEWEKGRVGDWEIIKEIVKKM